MATTITSFDETLQTISMVTNGQQPRFLNVTGVIWNQFIIIQQKPLTISNMCILKDNLGLVKLTSILLAIIAVSNNKIALNKVQC